MNRVWFFVFFGAGAAVLLYGQRLLRSKGPRV
jgi:hypothetical protein